MDYRDLKNFGVPMNQTLREAESTLGKLAKLQALAIVLKRLGISKMLKLPFSIRQERMGMEGRDFSALRAKGLEDQYFINYFIERTAVFSAMTQLIGEENAAAIHEEIMDSHGKHASNSRPD